MTGYQPIRVEPLPIHLLDEASKKLERANQDVIRTQRHLRAALERLNVAGVEYAKLAKDYAMSDPETGEFWPRGES